MKGPPIPVLYVEMDGTGVSMVKKETAGRPGKTAGQSAHTREAKLGCVFTQTTWDEEGYAIRDPDSTTYTGAIECAETFGKRIYGEAWKRGWSRSRLKVVLGDGAEWIWNLADLHFPGAIQIVDLYHAREHLWKLAHAIHPNDQVQQKRLDDVPPESAGQRPHREIRKLAAVARSARPRAAGGNPHRSQLL